LYEKNQQKMLMKLTTERLLTSQFAFIKIAAHVTTLMALLFIMARRYWLIAEEGRVNSMVAEFRDKMLPTIDDEAAEKRRQQNIRCQFNPTFTRAFII
jgi:hypothetical protein